MPESNSHVMTVWRTDLPADEWDARLAELGGHPLQSALWGDARRAVDGIQDHRWAVYERGRIVFMARFEVRDIWPIGRIAWIPRGPTEALGKDGGRVWAQMLERLRSSGYLICIDDPYRRSATPTIGVALLPRPRTAWIDLTIGRVSVFRAAYPQWRQSTRSARRQGVIVEQTRNPEDAAAFFALCELISQRKGFDLPGSASLLTALLTAGLRAGAQARLFVARFEGKLAAGAAILRCGQSVHYIWGAVDRIFSKQRTGEAVHDAIIDWACEEGLERYDLEGIDFVENRSTSQFKMKSGAVAVDLPGRQAYPLNIIGKVVLALGQRLGRI